MPFGGYSPLPLRLGSDPEQGWSCQAQSRLAADLSAARRTIPLATFTYHTGLFQILTYSSQYGAGAANGPAITGTGFKWAPAYKYFDETYFPFNVRAATISAVGSDTPSAPISVTLSVNPSAGSSLDFFLTDPTTGVAPTQPAILTVTVWGEWLPDRQIGDYDGATDKADSLTEGNDSYIHQWLLEMQAMRGSAYSSGIGNVDAENFAIARQLGALSRNAEKLEANSLPGTSDEKLETWVQVLGVPIRQSDQRWQVRQRAEAKNQAAASSAQPADIDAAVKTLLGNAFVAAHRTIGTTLSAPPANTYWPIINPGPSSLSLGGGAWRSDRSYYWVEVQQPAAMSDQAFRRLMDTDLFELLDQRLPAHMTFSWATSDGFILGVSLLGFAAFGPEP